MEANGIKKRIAKACSLKQKIKLVFQYPACDRATIKRGYVTAFYEDCFDFNEVYDGDVTYSYNYIVEISEIKEELK